MAPLGRLELPAYRFEASRLRGISNLERVGVAWRGKEITTDKCLTQPIRFLGMTTDGVLQSPAIILPPLYDEKKG